MPNSSTEQPLQRLPQNPLRVDPLDSPATYPALNNSETNLRNIATISMLEMEQAEESGLDHELERAMMSNFSLTFENAKLEAQYRIHHSTCYHLVHWWVPLSFVGFHMFFATFDIVDLLFGHLSSSSWLLGRRTAVMKIACTNYCPNATTSSACLSNRSSPHQQLICTETAAKGASFSGLGRV